jgi:hypothetical protein
MDDEMLGAAIIRAERAARNVVDSGLRAKAFEVILNRLLAPEPSQGIGWETGRAVRSANVHPDRAVDLPLKKEPKTLSQRILALQSDGFFKDPKTIGGVREGLRAHGWHYPATTLSGVLQGLIQKRRLRRERVREGRKTAWKYSNP